MKSLPLLIQFLILSSFAGWSLPSTRIAQAEEEAGLEVLKDRLRASTGSLIKETEELYDTVLPKSSVDPVVGEKTVKFLVATRQLKRSLRKVTAAADVRSQVQNLWNLLADLKSGIEQSTLYSDPRIQRKWSDVCEVWNVLRAVVYGP
jgi:hypothetical protein